MNNSRFSELKEDEKMIINALAVKAKESFVGLLLLRLYLEEVAEKQIKLENLYNEIHNNF